MGLQGNKITTAKEELNRIMWSKKENQKDYALFYLDRVLMKEVKLDFTKIKKIEGTFMELDRDVSIPLHRIIKIKKKGKLIWERKGF